MALAWLTGRVCSDRFGWSQWLLWMPTPVVMLTWMIALPAARRHRRAVLTWFAVLVALIGYFGLVEHRFLRGAADEPVGLRVMNWNLSYLGPREDDRIVAAIIELDPAVAVLLNAGRVPRHPALREWLGGEGRTYPMGIFTLVTKRPIASVGWAVSTEGIKVAFVTLDTEVILERPLTIYLVDLPSEPRWPRGAIAATTRGYLDASTAPHPDLVLGDFNMTRGGAALHRLFPEHRHAFDEAGTGYGATFRRPWPLYHIDHALLGPAIEATSYELIDPGLTRHRIQLVTITAAE